ANHQSGFPDNPANAAPGDWSQIESWGFEANAQVRQDVWLASVAEMADRVRADRWDPASDNLDAVLVHYPPRRAFLPLVMSQRASIGTVNVNTPQAFQGYTLLAPLQSRQTYLIDNDGLITHTWSSDYKPGNVAYLLEDGELLRSAMLEGPSRFTAGGAGGRVERFDWDGDLLWSFEYHSPDHRAHHDVELLPNGNLLMIAWEYKTPAQAIQAGSRPSLAQQGLWPDHIIEVNPAKQIVWRWHVWDHLVQDHDPARENYGIIADHPERIDVNYRTSQGADWNHVNAVDYNASLDQILLSVRHFNEIWIIDHSTTITQARGPAGDLLYRWGNPAAYGADGNQILYGQHDAHWLEAGLPGAGDVLLFNNGAGRTPQRSSVEQLALPVDQSGAYASLDATVTWSYELPADLYSGKISGAQRLPNGNTLACSGDPGVLLEVTAAGEVAWQYTLEPVPAEPGEDVAPSSRDDIFRAYRYAPDELP
ncbi:MAG: aryl-sulfate sulfotransferase, partial [Chloroflexota bacterium]